MQPIIMLLNHANIINSESRFLSNMVILEWLYPHLKNSHGATSADETKKIHVILDFILEYYWPNKVFKGNYIFHVLRNQLAHSGKLPINRDGSYVDGWMAELEWEDCAIKRG